MAKENLWVTAGDIQIGDELEIIDGTETRIKVSGVECSGKTWEDQLIYNIYYFNEDNGKENEISLIDYGWENCNVLRKVKKVWFEAPDGRRVSEEVLWNINDWHVGYAGGVAFLGPNGAKLHKALTS